MESGTVLENLRELCIPFTYFDEETDLQMDKITGILQCRDLNNRDELIVQVNRMQMLLRSRQQKILISFDYSMYCSLLLVFIAVIIIISDLFNERNKIVKAQAISQEQLKFRRDLHDGAVQDLVALKVYLEKKDEEKVAFYASHALNEVRYLIDSMHRDLSQPFSLSIKETLSDFENNFGIATHLMLVSENLDKISDEEQIELFRILQEALSNIGRHANATEVTVQFTEVGNDLKFNIHDNGVGFNKELPKIEAKHELVETSENTSQKHYGVKNIEERVLNLHGTVQFLNNGGTTIAITIKDFIRR